MSKSHHRDQYSSALGLLSVLCALALSATACSDSSASASDAVATLENDTAETSPEGGGEGDEARAVASEVDVEEAVLDFSQCMRDAGLDFPDIGLNAEGNPDLRSGFEALRGQDGFRQALDTCSDLLEGAGFGGRREALNDNVEVQDALIEFSACVREQGFNVGDLELGGPGAGGNGNGGEGGAGAGEGADGGEGAGTGEGAGGEERGNAAGGRGQRGFDPTSRFARGLGLDPEDPAVQAAVGECVSIIETAFADAGLGR